MTTSTTRWIYDFREGSETMVAELGGKGAALAGMTAAEIPVPPGFTIVTEAGRRFHSGQQTFPPGLQDQLVEAMKALEVETGKGFGGCPNPLLVSVRSGAPVSMPGMMDTVLNLGLNEASVEALATCTGDEAFAYSTYNRFLLMFAETVLAVPRDRLPERATSVESLQDLAPLRARIARYGSSEVPDEPYEQLELAISAVFKSWMSRRAVDYRRFHRIPEDLCTAVTVQAMVFGNMGDESGTGVVFTRNPNTGEPQLFGEYLPSAQGEDLVAGLQTPLPIEDLGVRFPHVLNELGDIAARLERHRRDMQDIEFTIERGKLWMLQTRSGKRSACAAVRIAVEFANDELITIPEAITRVSPDRISELLHPIVVTSSTVEALATGLPASPGGAAGAIVFDADEAQSLAEDGQDVVLIRHETSPDDFHGIVAAVAVVTSRGGVTSHAAVVARGLGKTCVVGCETMTVDYGENRCSFGDTVLSKGDWITVDGNTGRVYSGRIETKQPDTDRYFDTLMTWADDHRVLGVRANADSADEAAVALVNGAEGIGLCRTEHMFFERRRIEIIRAMIMAETGEARVETLRDVESAQTVDFEKLFTAMDGLPVTIRLLDPPLHEFLPRRDETVTNVADLKLRLDLANTPEQINAIVTEITAQQGVLEQIEAMEESNPMLGHRGCRLGITSPEITRMQARSIATAAVRCSERGISVVLEVMVPLVAFDRELAHQASIVRQEIDAVFERHAIGLPYLIGTMIELPRAALTAEELAKHADFFSFGTNDLTQSTAGLSRDDANKFLPRYIRDEIIPSDPFQSIDVPGVGQLVAIAMEKGRIGRPGIKTGVCGEHGGDPESIAFFHNLGLDYISCSPYRVPVARMAAAHAAIADGEPSR